MLMLKDEEKELLEYFDEIKSLPVVVEGKKDKAMLKTLGFTKIITLNKKGLYESVSKYEEEKIIILTDFDEKGEELAKKLELFLRKSDKRSRNKIRKLFRKNNITTVEGLRKIVKKVMLHGEIGSGHGKIYYLREIRGKRDSGKTRCNRSDIRSNRRSTRPGHGPSRTPENRKNRKNRG